MRLLAVLFVLFPILAGASDQQWLTTAEKSNFQETSRYAETIQFCRRLEKASPWFHYVEFGTSPEGRALPLLIASKQKTFTPEAARKAGLPVVLIINGIHAGEIAGKEASLMLLRDIALGRKNAGLLDHAMLLVVPIYNVDGHERFGPYNRINQNGPREMGWRTTAQNLNLNRDWLKADQPETRAMLKLFTAWLPDFAVDNHVSDGADFQYDLTYILQETPAVAAPIREYLQKDLEPFFLKFLADRGHLVTHYVDFRDWGNPFSGLETTIDPPRLSDGYGAVQNRPVIIVETHALKSFETRIKGHYDMMEALLTRINQEPEKLKEAVRLSDQQAATGREPYALSVKLNEDKKGTFHFKGVEYRKELSEISGTTVITYGTKPMEFDLPIYDSAEVDVSVTPPLAYIIPPEWTSIIERLDAHAIRYSRLTAPLTSTFETYRFTDVGWDERPYEGRHHAHFKTTMVKEERTLPTGSVVVRMNQRTNHVVMALLEPDAPDSLVSWGFFDAIFEQKEYGEGYVLEKLAREMLQKDEKLKQEFEDRLQKDRQFAANPQARLQFFFQRSPYWDRQKDAYPVVRVTDEKQLTLVNGL